MRDHFQRLHLKLNEVFELRDRLFPERDLQNTAMMSDLLAQYTDALKALPPAQWKPDENRLEPLRRLADKGVFICGYMKSGTTLLLELLDGHPELIVMPGDSHLINWINKNRDRVYSERTVGLETFWISRFINPKGQEPFWTMGDSDEPYLDLIRYLNYWLTMLPEADLSPFIAAVLAFHCANPRRSDSPKLWVEKTPGNETKVSQILDYLPSARFLHVIRDPRPNIASLKRLHDLRNWPWDISKVTTGLRKHLRAGLVNRERLGEKRYHILRYEDLLENTEPEMGKVASFLGIARDESLLQPTVNGLPTKANSMYRDRQVYGKVNQTKHDLWRHELSGYEKRAITATLSAATHELGYDLLNTGFSRYWLCLRYACSRIFN